MHNDSKILYICQNPSGIEAIELLAKNQKECTFYCLFCEEFFNQKISFTSLPNITPISIKISKLDIGFYGLSYISRVKRIRELYKVYKKTSLPDVDLIIYNNDGAFQRMICGYYNCKKVMILDGVLSGNEHGSFASFFKVKLLKFIYMLVPNKKNFYLPSILGISNPHKIFVVSSFCRSYLEKNYVDKTKIHVIGFTRLNGITNVDSVEFSSTITKIIFIAQAFNWHGLHKYNKAMIKEINFWRTICSKLNINFEVKLHPRNHKDDFNELKYKIKYKNDIDNENRSTMFVGMSSTYILECHNAGYMILISRTCNFLKKVDNLFYGPEFPVVNDLNEAHYYLQNPYLCKINNFNKNFTFGINTLINEIRLLL